MSTFHFAAEVLDGTTLLLCLPVVGLGGKAKAGLELSATSSASAPGVQ